MFTGIIETLGKVESLRHEDGILRIGVHSNISRKLKVDQSVAHNGVCLTVVDVQGHTHFVEAIDETLKRTNLGNLAHGDRVNLERCLKANGRLDGHIVQGHVDTVGVCTRVVEEEGSWRFYFTHPDSDEHITVPKGSITVNGVSLTVVDSTPGFFSVAIIPYTYAHTTFRSLSPGNLVNLEFDILGKYIAAFVRRASAK
jgi:riboflavin synthase